MQQENDTDGQILMQNRNDMRVMQQKVMLIRKENDPHKYFDTQKSDIDTQKLY